MYTLPSVKIFVEINNVNNVNNVILQTLLASTDEPTFPQWYMDH